MIQIDDAGSGSLIGGTCIAAIRVETKEFHYEIIPVHFYRKTNFKKKLYLDYVITIVKRLLKKLNVSKDESIEVCRGYMFDKLRKWFSKENYNFKSVKITDPLQTKIEKVFENYAISFGLPYEFISYTKYPFHFHRILKWVYADFNNRVKLCKTGWKSWSKYEALNLKTSYEVLEKSNYICLKCGSPINSFTKAKKITFISNRKNQVYLHSYC